ncbi:trp operon leader peptide [Streptomyces eurocidicus]|uniref:Trp operon leader peptide n=1 Tax=Streptomyces eurocidicus TaxID=66423 RepID=A0A7W8B855_STREU|nr:trp operon leader peptide [Streptomyces eurocidicus]MBB5118569.1 hypothetical protein [Streptomyces eurocidicus]MBF6052019.1 trp operon leader peptide [Streptomyces eurocidicus]
MDGTRPGFRPGGAGTGRALPPVRPVTIARGAPSGRVRSMFAQTTQNWWWTAHPAAH